ncbi:MAG: stage IV sporulation protein A [Clostridia bacterium]|nr:stage IV sporulation protein A [Clostridia bacterium]
MSKFDLYRDVSERCAGSLYLGVVGPVRTGKSTLIQRLLETLVLPGITDEHSRRRALDTMPQSAEGRTVMTTEPKFIPEEAVDVAFSDGAHVKMKLIDCVGYVVEGAAGTEEDGTPRMVKTPWQEASMTFADAAEIGTKRVMDTHANVGFVVTTDGSISSLGREAYVEAEVRVIREMKAQNKPFLILLNSAHPESEEARALCDSLQEKYGHPVILLDCLHLSSADAETLLEMILKEFPLKQVDVRLPAWLMHLDENTPIRAELFAALHSCAKTPSVLREVADAFTLSDERIERLSMTQLDYAKGCAAFELDLTDACFYRVLSDACGVEIRGNDELFSTLSSLSETAEKYSRIAAAIAEVEETGYGIVTPRITDLTLEEPEIVEKSGAYGVKLRASAPSIHMIRANIQTEVSPIVGSEHQSRDMVKFLLNEFEEDPTKIWESNLFGKTLHELVGEGLSSKLDNMPADARENLAAALEKIVNEGANGLICILF